MAFDFQKLAPRTAIKTSDGEHKLSEGRTPDVGLQMSRPSDGHRTTEGSFQTPIKSDGAWMRRCTAPSW